VLVIYLASVALVLFAWREAGLKLAFLPFAALYLALLVRQALRLRLDDPAGALRLFKSNTWAGLALFTAIVAGGAL
jgi:4-hydroxybenzoate polyprenyltransferase